MCVRVCDAVCVCESVREIGWGGGGFNFPLQEINIFF